MKLRVFLLTAMICALCVGQASAMEYTMDAPEDHLFGRPTSDDTIYEWEKYSLQGTTQGRYLTGGVPPVRFSM